MIELILKSVRRPQVLGASVVLLAIAGCGGGQVEPPSDKTTASAGSLQATAASVSGDASSLRALGLATDARTFEDSAPPDRQAQATASASAITTTPTTGTPRTIYVNAMFGTDTNDGLSARPVSGTRQGPVRSLMRLAMFGLNPGDTVMLACGSRWNDTLRIRHSGSETAPIRFIPYPAGCSNPPIIDGNQIVVGPSWSSYQGSIYKAPVPGTLVALTDVTGASLPLEAHHPNRGFDPSKPASPYVALSANGNTVTADTPAGRITGSTLLPVGSRLTLPAGATVGAGARARVRTHAWLIDEKPVSGFTSGTLQLAEPTNFPVTAGRGVYLVGELWMLDSPGEWFHDKTTGLLYTWMADSRPPGNRLAVSRLQLGVDMRNVRHVSVEGLVIRNVQVGVYAPNTTGVRVTAMAFSDIAGQGVEASGSSAMTVANASFTRMGQEAVNGQHWNFGVASGMQLLSNTVQDSGLRRDGQAVLSLPYRSYAALRPGDDSRVAGNTIRGTGYVGIWSGMRSQVLENVLEDTCMVLDDCGAIYAQGLSNGSTISRNLVLRAPGNADGKPADVSPTEAHGIYLDEGASSVRVTDNTLTGTDHGIHLHMASANTLSGNRIHANRESQIHVQQSRAGSAAVPAPQGNVVSGNQLCAGAFDAPPIALVSTVGSTSAFARFSANRYQDSLLPAVARIKEPSASHRLSLRDWANSGYAGRAAVEPDAWGSSMLQLAQYIAVSSNVVPNGDMVRGLNGWSVWNATAPAAKLILERCVTGLCANVTAGGSSTLLSSPNFSIRKDAWYRLAVDLTGATGQAVDVVVRRGGGGSMGYEAVSDRALGLTLTNTSTTRYSVVFRATATVIQNDPVTGDLGARIDFQNLMPGQSLRMGRLELVELDPRSVFGESELLTNASAAANTYACPTAAAAEGLCGHFFKLSDGQPVVWPLQVGARSGELVFVRNASLTDSDNDGVADTSDRCAGTLAGLAVDSSGCAVGQ